MSRIALIGVGAIGSVFGSRLCALERHEVTSLVRTPFEKFKIETSKGIVEAPANCVTDPAEAGPAEWVLLAVKGHQVESVAPWIKAVVGPDTTIAVLQNGVEHVERVTPFAQGAKVIPVVVQCPADRLGPGHVIQNAHAALITSDDEAGKGLAALYEGSDIPVENTPDIRTALWKKLCGNIAAGPVTALTNRGRGVTRNPDVAAFCWEMVRECIAVGRAEGADLQEEVIEKVAKRQFEVGGEEATTSMLVDRRAGLPIEADAITGAVVRLGERHGIDTPLNRAANAMLLAINVK